MLRIAICDDNINFIETFTKMITASFVNAGKKIKLFTFTDGKSLLDKVEKEKQIFDIIFLDVEMPVVCGFQVAQRLREVDAPFILLFTTYIEDQSRKGYLYGAFRYIFKNNLENEINEAIPSILKKFDNLVSSQEEIILKCRTKGILEDLTVKKVDIIYLKVESTRRITLKTVYSEYDLLVKPLAEYAKMLDSSIFFPIVRSYLLNFNHVESIEDNSFILTGGLTVPMGIKREARKSSMDKYIRFLEERI